MHLYIHFDPITIRHTVSADDALTALIQSIKEGVGRCCHGGNPGRANGLIKPENNPHKDRPRAVAEYGANSRRNPRMDMQPMGGNR